MSPTKIVLAIAVARIIVAVEIVPLVLDQVVQKEQQLGGVLSKNHWTVLHQWTTQWKKCLIPANLVRKN